MVRRFGKVLAEARKDKKITLRKLGQLVGLSPSFLSEIEMGRRLPPKDEGKIGDLAVVLNIDKDEFLSVAREERAVQRPKLFERLFNTNQDLAWGLYRAAEEASDDSLERAVQKLLEDLEKKGGPD